MNKIKNYIANPKSNGYQSLHTVIITEDQYSIEIQIRNENMHYHAESGGATHGRYKSDLINALKF